MSHRALGQQFTIHAPEPVPIAEEGHKRFLHQRDLPFSTSHRNAVRLPSYSEQVADAYESAPLLEGRAVPHYSALKRDVESQFSFLTRPRSRGGLGVDVSFQPEDPYRNAAEMFHDLHHNNRLRVLSTGGDIGGEVHPLLGAEHNDMFRAVHDFFGHAAAGRGFDRHGERGAYLLHRGMFSPSARPAMFTETEGQNSVFVRRREFPVQKGVILPARLRTSIPMMGRRTEMSLAVKQAQQSNEEHRMNARNLSKQFGGHQ